MDRSFQISPDESNVTALDAEQSFQSPLSDTILKLYRRFNTEKVRAPLRRWIVKIEQGPARSGTIRHIFKRFHRVSVGLFTAGPVLLKPTAYHPNTVIGRYTHIAPSVRTFTRNHPMNILSTHGFFYNPVLGKVKEEIVNFNTLRIGHGVHIGHNVIIVPSTQRIGEGAIIAPGSVVYFDVPPYAIVSGYPATVKGYRFPKPQIQSLLSSEWWKLTPRELEPRQREIIQNAATPEFVSQ